MLENSLNGINVKLISENMYHLKPDEHSKVGRLGVDIEIEGIKTLLSYEVAENILTYDQSLADEFVRMIIISEGFSNAMLAIITEMLLKAYLSEIEFHKRNGDIIITEEDPYKQELDFLIIQKSLLDKYLLR